MICDKCGIDKTPSEFQENRKTCMKCRNASRNKKKEDILYPAPVLDNQITFDERLDKFYKKPIEKIDTKYTIDTNYSNDTIEHDNPTFHDIQNIKTYKRTYKMTEESIRKLQEMKNWYPIGTTFDQMVNYAIMQIKK